MSNLRESERAVWWEMSTSQDEHGGQGWEFGSCIWSPTTDGIGRPYYGYEVLREPTRGDVVVHFYDRQLMAVSRVSARCRTVRKSPPVPGQWAGRKAYYRIELEGFRPFRAPVLGRTFRTKYLERIREDIRTNRPKMYPFVLVEGERINMTQGLVLCRCTPYLVQLICQATGVDVTAAV